MDTTIDKLLSHVYEIEGLIHVAKRMGDDTPDIIVEKIQRKVRQLAAMVDIDDNSARDETTVNIPAEPAGLPSQDYDADETWQHDNGEVPKEVFDLNYQEPKHDVPVADREPDEDIEVEFIMPEDEPDLPEVSKDTPELPAHEDEPVPEPDPDILPKAKDMPNRRTVTDYTEAPAPEIKEERPVPPTPTEFPKPAERPEPLRVDEKLQRRQARDIRKALSVNDRFYFQRELFAGSADALNNAIGHIEMMNCYGNAELFFYSQLGWDREDEVVKEFMSIVRNHFHK